MKMNQQPRTYRVSTSKFDGYLRSRSKRMLIQSVIITVVVLALYSWLIGEKDPNFSILPWAIAVVAITSVAGYVGNRIALKSLSRFKDATYEIDQNGISMSSSELNPRTITFDKLAVFDSKSKGTVLVKGGFWTKLDYYRPARRGYSLEGDNCIFIPSVTEDYDRLINEIKTFANKSN